MDIKLIKSILIEAGEIALDYFHNSNIESWQKEDKSIVTEADIHVEKFIRKKLTFYFPEIEIIGEELQSNAETEYAWIIDPIDGTTPFSLNIPSWCISLGLTNNKSPHSGFVYFPLTNDFYYTNKGNSYKNNQRIFVDQQDYADSNTVIAISNHTHLFFNLQLDDFPGAVLAPGSGIFNNMLFASGSCLATITVKPSLWDLAAACAIVTNAGGTYMYFDGTPFKLEDMWQKTSSKKPVFFASEQFMPYLQKMFSPKKT